jgi:hypothetical protein
MYGGVNARLAGLPTDAGFLWTHSTQTKQAVSKIQGNVRETRRCEPFGHGSGSHGNKRAANVGDALEPTILNLNSEKDAAWPQDAMDFREGVFLRFWRFHVMQHQHGNHRGKGFPQKWECRSVALQDGAVWVAVGARTAAALREFHYKIVAVFEAGHTSSAFS